MQRFNDDNDNNNNNNNSFNISNKMGVKLDHKHRYDHVPCTESVETSHDGKVTTLCNQQYELTELFLTINRTS